MEYYVKNLLARALPMVDLLLVPFVWLAAVVMKGLRSAGIQRFPLSKRALLQVGVFPIRNHYYEPRFDYRTSQPDFGAERSLPGVDWNVNGQLEFLEHLSFSEELIDLDQQDAGPLKFRFNNGLFESGDAEFWYQVIRAVRPKRIIEIGSGYSTLIATRAIRRNKADDLAYECNHICIEPYEKSWLEATGATVIRQRVEQVGTTLFRQLDQNDILFVDSSHIIRPEGDVLFEYLELLPSLRQGVIVHVHDIFSPRDYLKEWIVDMGRFWNEQYLLEAFLSHNEKWQIVGALNYLHHNHYDALKRVARFLSPDREPGSFYMRKIA